MIDASPFNEEVYYSRQAAPRLTAADVRELKRLARSNPRQRVRLCVHSDVEANVHEMVIVHSSTVYVRPHKHLAKPESYHLIEGSAIAVMFDDSGKVREAVHVSEMGLGGAFLYRIPADVYHCLLFMSDWVVFHETTSGPFDRTETVYASWAPADDDSEGISMFMRDLKLQIHQSQCGADSTQGAR